MHWVPLTSTKLQTSSALSEIMCAHTMKYLSYCRQIPYHFIVPFNRFSICTKWCHKCQLPTFLAYQAPRTSLTSRVHNATLLNFVATRLHQSTVLATKQPRPQSGWLHVLSLRLPDPRRQSSERTTDWGMTSLWSQYHRYSGRPVVEDTAYVYNREKRTLWASDFNAQTV